MNHLSEVIRKHWGTEFSIFKDFENVDVVLTPQYHGKLGARPDVLYLNLEPYNRELTSGYKDNLIDKIINTKKLIGSVTCKEIIIIDDLLTIYCND